MWTLRDECAGPLGPGLPASVQRTDLSARRRRSTLDKLTSDTSVVTISVLTEISPGLLLTCKTGLILKIASALGASGQGWLRLLGQKFFRDKWTCLSG